MKESLNGNDARATLNVDDSAECSDRTARTAPVSVVVPCFRCSGTIGSAVASVAAQSLLPAEVVLVDDCSGDDTLEHLHRIAGAYPAGWIKVMTMPRNGGPSGARNRGWEQSRQRYIAFLDSDDAWHPQKLQIQMDVLAGDPQMAMLAHRMNVQGRSVPPPPLQPPVKVRVITPRVLQIHNPFPTASVILRRDLPFRFDENRRRSEDFLLWAQIVLSGHRAALINQVLASWHKAPFGAGGLSGDLVAMYEAGNDARRTLHAQGLLSRRQLQFAQAMSAVRYARRRAITFWRRRFEGFDTEHAA